MSSYEIIPETNVTSRSQEMHEQMSGYKRMRREHQAALLKLEERCKADVDAHKTQLDREYDALLQQLSRELERLQVLIFKYNIFNYYCWDDPPLQNIMT